MNRERELLGVYIYSHPMAGYDRPDNATAIGDASTETAEIMGVITALDIRHRKKDGKPMAFLTLEDTTGEIQCEVFTSAYNSNKQCLEEGLVLTSSHG